MLPYNIVKAQPVSESIKGPDTIFNLRKQNAPVGHKVTYANFTCNILLQKAETHRFHITAGGNKLDNPVDASFPAISILDAKIHINGTISNTKHGDCYIGLDIEKFYSGMCMNYFQYI